MLKKSRILEYTLLGLIILMGFSIRIYSLYNGLTAEDEKEIKKDIVDFYTEMMDYYK